MFILSFAPLDAILRSRLLLHGITSAERKRGILSFRRIISGTSNGRAKRRPWISYEAHAGARDELYDECSEPARFHNFGDSYNALGYVIPEGCYVHPSIESMHTDDAANPIKGISPLPFMCIYVWGIVIRLLSFVSYIRILRATQNRSRANKIRESLIVSELQHADENGKKFVEARDDIFSPFPLLKKEKGKLKNGNSFGICESAFFLLSLPLSSSPVHLDLLCGFTSLSRSLSSYLLSPSSRAPYRSAENL